MAIHYARVCGACERECPSWANRCASCGSSAISFQLIIAPPSGTSITKIADTAPRLRRSRVPAAAVADAGLTARTSALT